VGQDNANWYRRKKAPRQTISLWIRFFSLVLAFAGGLCPLLPSNSRLPDLQPYGYLLLGAGGGLLLFDKLFGISSAWMRFVHAALEIEACMHAFRMEWIKARAILPISEGGASLGPLCAIASQTLSRIDAIVQRETAEWESEFHANIVRQTQIGNLKAANRGREHGH
jgi:hypothetical protein